MFLKRNHVFFCDCIITGLELLTDTCHPFTRLQALVYNIITTLIVRMFFDTKLQRKASSLHCIELGTSYYHFYESNLIKYCNVKVEKSLKYKT